MAGQEDWAVGAGAAEVKKGWADLEGWGEAARAARAATGWGAGWGAAAGVSAAGWMVC